MYSKLIMGFIFGLVSVIVIPIAIMAVINGETPYVLLEYSLQLFTALGISFGAYCVKAGVENKTKIKCAHIERLNGLKDG